MVKVTIVYDMDDTEKSLEDELHDWIAGNISVQDVMDSVTEARVTIDAIDYTYEKEKVWRNWD